jgi:hypothetical protein
VAAGSVHNVRVTGPFAGLKERLVEKVIVSTDHKSVLAAPTTFISSDAPYLPIANTSTRPWFIRAGDIVGKLHDPNKYADQPKDKEEPERFAASAESFA